MFGGTAVDANGNAYVGGQTNGSLTGLPNVGGADFFVSKYSATGTLQTPIIQDGTVNDDTTMAIDVDLNGNILVLGNTYGSFDGRPNDAATLNTFFVKYAVDGAGIPTQQFGDSNTVNNAYGYGLVYDDINGAVYLVGGTEGSIGTDPNNGAVDYYTIKLLEAGFQPSCVGIDSVDTPTETSSQTITGTKCEGYSVSLSVEAPSSAVISTCTDTTNSAATTWSCSLENFSEGANMFTATASNGVDPDETDQATIDYTPAPLQPCVTIDPVDTPTDISEQTVYGTKCAGHTVVVSVSPSPPASVSSCFDVDVPSATTWNCLVTGFESGPYVVTATASNGVDPDETAEKTIEYQAAPNSIVITKASYNNNKQILTVYATSDLGANAALELQGYSPMEWDSKQGRWEWVGSASPKPTSVTVSGSEGSATAQL